MPKTAATPSRAKRRGLTTAQVPQFAAKLNRECAIRITDSPVVTAAAAILSFSLLDAETQIEMVTRARVEMAKYRPE